MDFRKNNLLKKFQQETPIGLSAFKFQKSDKAKSKKKSKSLYPSFFVLDRVAPVGI